MKYYTLTTPEGEDLPNPFAANDASEIGLVRDLGYTWVETEAPAPDPAAKLAADMEFGASLIREFLLGNRNDPNVKTADSLALLVKFSPAENLLRLGDIRKCRGLIDSFGTDLIFTVERKQNYLNLIDTYLSA